jgi:hypothetical protein
VGGQKPSDELKTELDVLYVADAFQVMAKLNALLAAKASCKEELATAPV